MKRLVGLFEWCYCKAGIQGGGRPPVGFIPPAEGPFLACVSRPVVYMLWLTSSRLEAVVGGVGVWIGGD